MCFWREKGIIRRFLRKFAFRKSTGKDNLHKDIIMNIGDFVPNLSGTDENGNEVKLGEHREIKWHLTPRAEANWQL